MTRSNKGHTDLLRTFGLARNPFVDRTAERTGALDDVALFVPSDLRGFSPSETTYVFFGRRGSGKTTIRIMMQRAYREANLAMRSEGRSRGHFIIDFSRPGFLTARLKAFKDKLNIDEASWDAVFSSEWTTADVVDCILSMAATTLVAELSDPRSIEGQDMLRRLQGEPKAARQLLLLVFVYADADTRALEYIRASLVGPAFNTTTAVTSAVGAAAVTGGVVLLNKNPEVAEALAAPFERAWDELAYSTPFIGERPGLSLAVAGITGLTAGWFMRKRRVRKSLERAVAIQSTVRVVRQQPVGTLASLLNLLFSSADDAERVRALGIGISAHQKLDKLASLLHLLGFEFLACFGDCFDEVSLLDPVQYPAAMKAWARELCRNDLLNFGRMHFFFPDSRIALDLNTDKTLKEARFDRHFVRDLTWSRHQLEELAERRFLAAQLEAQRRAATALSSPKGSGSHGGVLKDDVVANGVRIMSFNDLFKGVKADDFSGALSKLSTPRELMIMMTELMGRIEANPEGGVSSQDLEIAVSKALEQAV